MLTLGDEGSSRNQGSRIRSFGENGDSKETLCEHKGITLLTKRLEWCREENIPARHFKFVFPAKRLMSNARSIAMVRLQEQLRRTMWSRRGFIVSECLWVQLRAQSYLLYRSTEYSCLKMF